MLPFGVWEINTEEEEEECSELAAANRQSSAPEARFVAVSINTCVGQRVGALPV
jgi:hypothetical protein